MEGGTIIIIIKQKTIEEIETATTGAHFLFRYMRVNIASPTVTDLGETETC